MINVRMTSFICDSDDYAHPTRDPYAQLSEELNRLEEEGVEIITCQDKGMESVGGFRNRHTFFLVLRIPG